MGAYFLVPAAICHAPVPRGRTAVTPPFPTGFSVTRCYSAPETRLERPVFQRIGHAPPLEHSSSTPSLTDLACDASYSSFVIRS